jgi:serine/threonine-protein kinase RsbW
VVTGSRAIVERLPALPPNIRRVRAVVAGLLEENGWVDEDFRTRVMLAVSEVVANAVRHAYAGTEPGDVEVTAVVDGGELRVAVRDFGSMRLPAASPGMGVGLQIVERCSDEAHVMPLQNGTTVELVFRR